MTLSTLIDVPIDTWHRWLLAAGAACVALIAIVKVARPVWASFRRHSYGKYVDMFLKAVGDIAVTRTELTAHGSKLSILSDRLGSVEAKVAFLEKEARYNGGSSNKDMLRNTSARVEALINLSSEAVYETDQLGRCIRANFALCKLFGASESQMLGYGWTSFIVEDERHLALQIWTESVETKAAYEAEHSIVNGVTRKRMKVRTRAAPVQDPYTKEVLLWQGKVACLGCDEPSCGCRHRRSTDV